MVLAHPPGDEGKERQPKQQMQIRPKNSAIYATRGLDQMMVIVPVDAQVKETQHVTQKNRQERFDSRPIQAVRHLELQHHDCDDDREHSVAKRFESVLIDRKSTRLNSSH